MGFNGRQESSVYHVYVYPDLSGDCGRIVFLNRSLILADLIQFSTQYKGIENTLLKELAMCIIRLPKNFVSLQCLIKHLFEFYSTILFSSNYCNHLLF